MCLCEYERLKEMFEDIKDDLERIKNKLQISDDLDDLNNDDNSDDDLSEFD